MAAKLVMGCEAGKPTMPAKNIRRRGAALLVCIFVMAMTTVVVVAVLDSQMIQRTALRQTLNYEKALFLAGAGAHHALVELEIDDSWRTGIPSTEFPAGSGDTYAATVVDGTGGAVIITATGTAGGITRTLEVTIEPA
jgi:hypothetical protein